MKRNRISVIIPTYNEERYIKQCLNSVLSQDYPAENIEILVIDGGSSDRTRELIMQYTKKYPTIRILDNHRKVQVVAFNIGIQNAVGDIIVGMGAHAIYEPDYIRQCVHLLDTTDASNVGGIPKATATNYIGNTVALAMMSPFGVGNAYFRFRGKEMYVDSVFGGAWRKETLSKLGGFNEEYQVNEDYELNYRLRKAGGKILLSPKIRCRYFVRNSLRKLAKQYFRYGMWKVKTLVEHPHSLVYRQIVPPLFVISLIGSAIMLPLNWKIGILVPLLYAVTSIVVSVKISLKHGLKFLPILPADFATMHISWGTGFLWGLKRFGIPRVGVRQVMNIFRNVK